VASGGQAAAGELGHGGRCGPPGAVTPPTWR